MNIPAALAVMALFLAGCVQPGIGPASDHPLRRPVVLALLDGGINPYHETFAASGGHPDAGEFASIAPGARVVDLTASGTYEERREADDAFWGSVELGALYAFRGTNLFGIHLADDNLSRLIEDATLGHGTGTAGLVARDAPGTLIVMVRVSTVVCAQFDRTDCFVHPSVAAGMSWVAEQDWIDGVSVSLGLPGNFPDPDTVHPEARAYLEASRRVVESGKFLVTGTGNWVTPPFASYFAGPPWVISVGGFEPGPRGESVLASKTLDVAANFTEYRARAGSLDGYAWESGTSFSGPIVAGTLAAALQDVRSALGHVGGITADGALALGRTADGRELRVTAWTLRDALNASALAVAPTEWDPTRPTSNETLYQILGASAPIVAGPAQTGWGYVHAGLARDVARRVLAQDDAMPGKELTAEWMRAEMGAREAYWASAGAQPSP